MATKYEKIYKQIKTEITRIREEYKYSNDSSAFGHFMVKAILDLTDEEANEAITDGFNDNGIDAIYIDTRNQKTKIHFFQFKFPASADKIDGALKQDELLKLINGYEHFIGNNEKFNSIIWNDLLKEKREEFTEIEDSDNNILYIVRFTTNTTSGDNVDVFNSKIKSLHNQTGNIIEGKCLFAGEITSIYEKTRLNGWPDFKIKFKKDLSLFEDNNAKVCSYYVSLYSIYEALENLETDVFAGNVRYFDECSKVNNGIIETLSGDNCSRFHLLNNGITIVCSDVITKSSTDEINITRGSIVNGAQTVGCIMKKIKEDISSSENISSPLVNKYKESFVFLRVIKIENKQELIDELVYTLNTQNQMKSSYSISNDLMVKAIQTEVNKNTKYFLQLKNNEYNYQKSNNSSFNKLVKDIIDIELAFQTFVAYENINDLAYLSKNNKALLFDDENRIKIVNELNKEELILSYELYLSIMSIIRSYRAYRKDNTKNEILSILNINDSDIDNFKYLNTGNYLILYALGLYCRKFNLAPEHQIVNIIKIICPLFSNAPNISNLTKSKEMFDKVKNMIDTFQQNNKEEKQTIECYE